MPPADAPILDPPGPDFIGPPPREMSPKEIGLSSISVWKKAAPR